MRNKQAEEFEPVLPEADDQNDGKADRCKQAGNRELAGDRERMDPRNNTKGHHAKQVGKQDEHEQGKDPRRIFLAVGTDAVEDQIIDKSDNPLNHDLPAARDELALHSACHEHIKQAQDHKHP